MQHLEIIFTQNLHPGDVDILTPASPDRPGQAQPDRARKDDRGRLYSHNGGALIGYVAEDEPIEPYQATYWLIETKEISLEVLP